MAFHFSFTCGECTCVLERSINTTFLLISEAIISKILCQNIQSVNKIVIEFNFIIFNLLKLLSASQNSELTIHDENHHRNEKYISFFLLLSNLKKRVIEFIIAKIVS